MQQEGLAMESRPSLTLSNYGDDSVNVDSAREFERQVSTSRLNRHQTSADKSQDSRSPSNRLAQVVFSSGRDGERTIR